ncbi:HK97 gp10 family phage protein [Sporosarcina sp. resist]|uniref:HK97 gp10 family phage protein n=1 Tax=Sporosarcina sp. resist TaxID=2762563 RepID=UPI00164E845E|nr:HK97 gp10 family phage protein [Sporosarcina sp. resist]QNK87750.1 HK97 gp10 family phage protein [Sporosarcina sp. resist]
MKFGIDGLEAFAKALDNAANGGLKEEYSLWLEAMGFEFLDLIQDEIIRTGTVETRLLLNSFVKGDSKNVWEMHEGGLSLLIGTNVNYAWYVNDGHWTNKEGVATRWVPGVWKGNRFEYTPGAETGMMLKQKWVEGSHYWDNAFAIFTKLFEKSLDRRLQEWLDKAF